MTDKTCPNCGYPGRFCRCVGSAGGELIPKAEVLVEIDRRMDRIAKLQQAAETGEAKSLFGSANMELGMIRRFIAALPAGQGEADKVLDDVMQWIDNWAPKFTGDPEWSTTEARVAKILGKQSERQQRRAHEWHHGTRAALHQEGESDNDPGRLLPHHGSGGGGDNLDPQDPV